MKIKEIKHIKQDLSKINGRELEEQIEEYVDKPFQDVLKSLLPKNIVCSDCIILDTQEDGLANQGNNQYRYFACVMIPFYNDIRLSEENRRIFAKLAKENPSVFIDRFAETKTENYKYVVALPVNMEDDCEEISKKLVELFDEFKIQDCGCGLTEEDKAKFDFSLSSLFPEEFTDGHYELNGRSKVWVANTSGHYELRGDRKVWVTNSEFNPSKEVIRERILSKYDLDDFVLDENNQLWEPYHYERHIAFEKAQKEETDIQQEEN